MKKLTLPVLALLAALPAGASFASDNVDPALAAQLREKLVAEGYEVRKIEMDDGLIEAYALKDGTQYELYFTADLEPVGHDEDSDS